MNGFIDLADELIDTARHESQERAKHSFTGYHAHGVTCLNLLRSPELTCKLYLFDGSHKLNADGFVVDPHSHAYPFHSTVLHGSMRNVTFVDFAPEHTTEHARPWHHFTVDSTKGGPPVFRNTRAVKFLHQDDAPWQERGKTYFLAPDAVHSIVVPQDEVTILFLCQYARERGKTMLYRRTPDVSVRSEGLYQPMTKKLYEEKLHLVQSILDIATPDAKEPLFKVGDCVRTGKLSVQPRGVSPHARQSGCIGEVVANNEPGGKAMVAHPSGVTAEYLYSELSPAEWTDWPLEAPYVAKRAGDAAAKAKPVARMTIPGLKIDAVPVESPLPILTADDSAPLGYVRASDGVLVDLRDPDNVRPGMAFQWGRDGGVVVTSDRLSNNSWRVTSGGGVNISHRCGRGELRFIGMDPVVCASSPEGRRDCERFGIVDEADAPAHGFARTTKGFARDLRKMENVLHGMVFKAAAGHFYTARYHMTGLSCVSVHEMAFSDSRRVFNDHMVVFPSTSGIEFYGINELFALGDGHEFMCAHRPEGMAARCTRAVNHTGDHEMIAKNIRWGRS